MTRGILAINRLPTIKLSARTGPSHATQDCANFQVICDKCRICLCNFKYNELLDEEAEPGFCFHHVSW